MNEETKIKIKKFLDSKVFKTFVYVFGLILLASLIFQAGMIAGYRKASFSKDWKDNYNKNFGAPHRGPLGMSPEYLPNAHGAIGRVIKKELPTIIVSDKDNLEKVVLIKDDTKIRRMKVDMKIEDLKVDDFIVVIGTPNKDGQVEAKLIRIMPAPTDEMVKGPLFIKSSKKINDFERPINNN